MVTTNALPGRTHWQGGDQPDRQAHTFEETPSYEYIIRNKIKKMLHFVEMTHEVAETVIFRQCVPYVPVDSR